MLTGMLARIFTERPAAGWVRRSPRAPWIAVATVCTGAFMGQLDASIVSLALPPMREEFHASSGGIEWVALSYLLTLVALVAPIGRASDWIGRKAVYTYGFGVFTLASAACALAPNLWMLIAFRVIQAIGASMLQANSVALIATSVPRELLSKAIGVQGAAQAVGLALGPTVGGILVSFGDWRWIFAINVPFGIIGIVAGWYLLPTSASLAQRSRTDPISLLSFVSAIVLAMLGLSLIGQQSSGLAIGGGLICAAVVVGMFFWWQARRSRAPALALKLFAHRDFSRGILSGLVSYAVLFGVLFAVPIAVSAHTSAATTGLLLTTLPVILAVLAAPAGFLAHRFGYSPVTMIGLALAAAGLILLGALHSVSLLPGLVVLGIGSGLFTPANNASIMAAVDPMESGSASGTLNMTRGLGTALGVSAATLLVHPGGAGFAFTMYLFAAIAAVTAVLILSGTSPRAGAASNRRS